MVAVGLFGRSIESIGSVICEFFDFFAMSGARDLSSFKVSALYDAWSPKKCRKNPKRKFSEFFGSVGWVFCSVRRY